MLSIDRNLPNQPQEEILEELDPLALDASDEVLVETIDTRNQASLRFWDGGGEDHEHGFDLSRRQKKIEDYVLGRQVDENDLHPSQKVYMENVLWEAFVRNRAILMSRMPDVVVEEGDRDGSEESAETLTKVVERDLKKEVMIEVLGMAALHRPMYFFGVIKARWNQEKDDYEFVTVHPKRIILDHSTHDPKKLKFITELLDTTVEEVLLRFPKKKDEFLKELGSVSALNWKKGDENSKRRLATRITISETWFKERLPVTDPMSGKKKWQTIVGVAWKYKNCILGKMKHPYWDWQGQPPIYDPAIKEPGGVSDDELYSMIFGSQADSPNIYYNYLTEPEFPYYIVTLNRMGEHCIDVTTDYEQVLHFQDNINREGIQITEMNARTIGKEVYSIDAFENEEDIENIDPHDMSQVIKVKGDDVRRVHAHIDYPGAPPQLYKSKQENRSIAFEMLALNATTRGTREAGDETLGARQMMREQDFGVLDYEVSRTINPAAQWMARWMLHFIKRYYTKPKMREMFGDKGQTILESISRDMVSDGMEVRVTASGVDKMQRKRQAQIDAQGGMTDPLSYFEALEEPNPEERADRLMTFKISPPLYQQQIVKGQNVQEMTQQLGQMPPEGQMGMPPQASVSPEMGMQQPMAPQPSVV